MANPVQNYYTNPAFCQQSEFYRAKGTSPTRRQTPRQSPVGANFQTLVSEDVNVNRDTEDYEEQEFYEEMLVDDSGFVKRKNLVVVTSPNNDGRNVSNYMQNCSTSRAVRYAPVGNHRYEEITGGRYEEIQETGDVVCVKGAKTLKGIKNRYDYVPIPQDELQKRTYHEELELDTNAIKEGYALVRKNDRYELLPLEKISDTYRYNQPTQTSRYEYVQHHQRSPERLQKALSPQAQRRASGNPVATQKLHELLATPKKSDRSSTMNHQTPQKMASPRVPRRVTTPPMSSIPKDPFVTPPKLQSQRRTPKAQQKLNYAIGARQMCQDKRNTAIITPMCSSPVQSIYNETTYSTKTESWMNLSGTSKVPVHTTLAVAAVMMVLCGGVTSGLCFYMISIMGRLYYLDFGIVAGFTCFLLGMLGYKTRHCNWLPHRNYISG